MAEEEIVVTTQEEPKLPDSWFWIKGSDGQASVTATFATVSFWVVTASYILSMFESVGPVTLRQFDSAAASVYMVPLLMAYIGRRYTDARWGQK